MLEYTLYEPVRDAYQRANASSFWRPLTEDFVISIVGSFGLDILVTTKLITPTDNPGQYVLSCEV